MPLVLGIVGAVAAVGSTVAGAVTAANGASTQHAAGEQAAQAAQGIANAQQGVAKEQMGQALKDRQTAMQLAAPSAQEIQQIGDRLQQQSRYQAVQEASLQRDEKILGSLDPALVTAGQQANNLMQGKEASILKPMKQQQDMQRKQLQAKLSAQLGPGYETSSVGQQALQQFDMQASMGIQQAQMQSFNQVSQFLGFNLGQRTAIQAEERQGFRTGSEMSADTLRMTSGIQQRQVNAFQESGRQISSAYGALRDTAGAEYAGQAAKARAMQGEGQSQSQVGGALLGAGLGGIAGGALNGLSGLGGGGGANSIRASGGGVGRNTNSMSMDM